MAWPTNSIPTYGRGVWLECNGQSFDRNRFPQLYETLGKTTVPDYRNRFLVAVGSKYSIGATGGEDTHRLTVDEMPKHRHTYGWIEYTNTPPSASPASTASYDIETIEHSFWIDYPDIYTTNVNKYSMSCGEDSCSLTETPVEPDFEMHYNLWVQGTSHTGGDNAHENRPPYIAVKWMIKAK